MLHKDFRRTLCVARIDQAVRKQRSGFHGPTQDRQGCRPPGHAKELQGEHSVPEAQQCTVSGGWPALEFATFLPRNALQYDAGAGEWGDAEEITISGDDMQRWVLKLFLNHAVTGHFDVQQNKTVTFPTEAIDLLLDRAAWPPTWGLTVPGETRSRAVRACPHQFHVELSAAPSGFNVHADTAEQSRPASRESSCRTSYVA